MPSAADARGAGGRFRRTIRVGTALRARCAAANAPEPSDARASGSSGRAGKTVGAKGALCAKRCHATRVFPPPLRTVARRIYSRDAAKIDRVPRVINAAVRRADRAERGRIFARGCAAAETGVGAGRSGACRR